MAACANLGQVPKSKVSKVRWWDRRDQRNQDPNSFGDRQVPVAGLRGKRVQEVDVPSVPKRQAFPCPVAYIVRKRPRQGEAHIRVLKFRHMTAFEVHLSVLQKVRGPKFQYRQ